MTITFTLRAQDQQDIQIANEYLLKGEKQKALAMFQTLSKNQQNISLIHVNYFNLLLDLGDYKQAEDYIEKQIKRESKITYRLDLGILYLKQGEVAKADKYLKNLIKSQSEDIYKMKSIADYLSSQNLTDYAIYSLQEARHSQNSPALFTLELANLYRIRGKREEMVNEYLNYVTQTPANTTYVKNIMQMLLTKPEELETLERLLYDRVQKNQESEVFADLLIWVNLQQKNFYGAFIQARAYDKRFKKDQSKTLEIAQIALNNQDYQNADKSFSFVIKEFPNTDNFLPAQLGLIKTREAKVKKTYPVNKDSVHYLIKEYAAFRSKYPDHPSAFEAKLNEALLHAYYLHELDSAILDLNTLIGNNKASAYLKAQAKIDLGDIYLLKEEPWESTLLYSQVEKTQKESPIGYEAKLRNAKLSYYKGDFRLAQEHLDILKQATTREIANDAMELSMRIKENTTFDSTGSSLRKYAAIELLLYQNKLNDALAQINNLKKDLGDSTKSIAQFSSEAILDDVYWLEANLRMKQGQFQQAINLLQKIIDQFANDVLADDAYFLQGDIYENQLHNKDKAMEIYREFLNKFPGSVYAAEARKRYRQLRGDFETVNPN